MSPEFENRFKFVAWLKCEHCSGQTVLFNDLKQTESKCANGDCGKISKLDENIKQQTYVKFLEERTIHLTKLFENLLEKNKKLTGRSFLVKTKDGHRLVYADHNSIQWALTEKIEYLS